ncbi:hypothetical protein SCT_2620 [Sulfuricella sp. T08]|uniref:hypothetical protein n=1 Tax=Sulfuricella sp. T08 TaxID=1632857 RepID=UPI0006179B5D|nr:hypothetical protein [Sulfuricella sp. T08]GAO37202.1 hypothetical protein SCT_2620 [Sulfuricella sp. T08]
MPQKIVMFIAAATLTSTVYAGEYGSGPDMAQQAMKSQAKTEMQARKETLGQMSTEDRQAKFAGMRDKMQSRMGTHRAR